MPIRVISNGKCTPSDPTLMLYSGTNKGKGGSVA